MKPFGVTASLMIAVSFSASSALGRPWVESEGGFELNWSNLLIKFNGQVITQEGDGDALKQVDRVAWRNGFDASAKVVDAILGQQVEALRLSSARSPSADGGSALEAGRQAYLKTVKSLETTYYASGQVQMAMQGQLRSAFGVLLGELALGSEASDSGSGDNEDATLVLTVPTSTKPVVAFWLVDSEGDTLFSPKNVNKSVLSQGTMASWFKGHAPENILKSGKSQSLQVVKVMDGARFVVDREAFKALLPASHKSLTAGKVVIVGT